jgi:aspartyl-tRNA(Asn)/glutamyl-tRNA(Gln) amidotransferase subunit B
MLNTRGLGIADSPVAPGNLGRLIDLIADGTISGRIAKDVFDAMVETGADPFAIVKDKGLEQITDEGVIEAAVEAVVAANPDKADEVRAGKTKLIGWFVGQVMQATGGKANPRTVNAMLARKLGT